MFIDDSSTSTQLWYSIGFTASTIKLLLTCNNFAQGSNERKWTTLYSMIITISATRKRDTCTCLNSHVLWKRNKDSTQDSVKLPPTLYHNSVHTMASSSSCWHHRPIARGTPWLYDSTTFPMVGWTNGDNPTLTHRHHGFPFASGSGRIGLLIPPPVSPESLQLGD